MYIFHSQINEILSANGVNYTRQCFRQTVTRLIRILVSGLVAYTARAAIHKKKKKKTDS